MSTTNDDAFFFFFLFVFFWGGAGGGGGAGYIQKIMTDNDMSLINVLYEILVLWYLDSYLESYRNDNNVQKKLGTHVYCKISYDVNIYIFGQNCCQPKLNKFGID